MELIELPHLSVGSPSKVAPPCVPQVEMRELFGASRLVKAGSQFVGERLVMDKSVCACRRDGALVEVHGLERASLDTGNLGPDQCGAILEVLRTIRRPGPKLSLVPTKRFAMPGIRVRADRLAACSASQCGIEVILLLLQHEERQRAGHSVPCLHFIGGVDCRHVIAGEETRLELSDP